MALPKQNHAKLQRCSGLRASQQNPLAAVRPPGSDTRVTIRSTDLAQFSVRDCLWTVHPAVSTTLTTSAFAGSARRQSRRRRLRPNHPRTYLGLPVWGWVVFAAMFIGSFLVSQCNQANLLGG